MGDIISVIDFIITHKEYVILLLIACSFLLSCIILLSEYKMKVLYYISHRRNKYWFVIVVLSAIGIVLLVKFTSMPLWCGIILSVIWITFLFYTCIRVKSRKSYINPILNFYQKKLRDGYAFEYLNYFKEERHWYFMTVSSALEYAKLRAAYYFEIREYKISYEVLSNIAEANLYENEKENIKYQRALMLCFLGSINSALELIGPPEANQSKDPILWFAYSYCYELQANIDLAYEYIRKAKSLADTEKISQIDKAQIYNNYGRICLFQKNPQEAIHFYRIAYRKAKDTKDNRYLYVILPNYIISIATYEKDKEECERLLAEYKRLLRFDTIKNLNEYDNLLLEVNRQFSDDKAIFKSITDTYAEISPKLKADNKAVFNASNLRILLNGRFNYSWMDKEIEKDLIIYNYLSFQDKMVISREYMGIFFQENFKFLLAKEPYRSLYSYILNYYQTEAINDIDRELSLLEPYEIYKYKNLTLYKLSILKILEKEKHIDNSKELYISLFGTIKKAGCKIDAVNILLILMDECTSPYNLLIKGSFGQTYYYQFLQNTYPSIEPEIAIDGIHIMIQNYVPKIPCTLIPLKNDVINQYITIAVNEVSAWFNHPAKNEMCLQLCRILLGLGRVEEGRKMYLAFKESKRSIDTYALWFQQEIQDIEAFFKNNE